MAKLFTVYLVIMFVQAISGGSRSCSKELKKAFPKHKIAKKPLQSSSGTCNLSQTCCTGKVEQAVKADSLQQLHHVISKEVEKVRGSLDMITGMTAVTMTTMMNDLVPEDIATILDINKIGDMIWAYTMGNITSYELTVELAVIGSGMIFTEAATQQLRDMTECIIRELAEHNAFQKISEIVESVLEAPRTFGKGFEVVGKLLEAMMQYKVPEDCDYAQLFGCPRCGIKMPSPCHSSCMKTTQTCLQGVVEMVPLWSSWVESISRLVDAMVLMKDIKIDPNELVTPELIEEITDSITLSMFSANFRQCRSTKKRRSVGPAPIASAATKHQFVKRGYSEGDMMSMLLRDYFSKIITDSCRNTKSDDSACWLGNEVGDYVPGKNEPAPQRETKSYSGMGIAAMGINEYNNLVDNVISNIHAKVRAQRDSPPNSEYMVWSGSVSIYRNSIFRLLQTFGLCMFSFLLRNTL